MTKAGFGEHLKRERELRGVSLEEICGATRIGTRFLEALEKEEWERLPGGIFNRGFVRAVARYLGLDEEGLVAEYGLAMNEQQNAVPVWMNPPAPTTSKRWLPWVGLAVALVLAGAGWFAWRHHVVRRSRSVQPHAAEAVAVPTDPLPLAGDSSIIAPASAPVDEAGPSALFQQPLPDHDLHLEIEAGKTTTLTVSADGNPAFDGLITAGQKQTFTAETSFSVSAEDSGAILVELNGRTLAPLGRPGEPGKVTLTRRDLAAAAGGPD